MVGDYRQIEQWSYKLQLEHKSSVRAYWNINHIDIQWRFATALPNRGWIFYAPSQGANWTDFKEWIESDSPLYWITGKAGAGKSTLMKFIGEHDHTKRCLQTWTASRHLLVAPGPFYTNFCTKSCKQRYCKWENRMNNAIWSGYYTLLSARDTFRLLMDQVHLIPRPAKPSSACFWNMVRILVKRFRKKPHGKEW